MTFKKATFEHKNTIFSWLDEPHIKAFWDNSQAHRDDIENFMSGRKILSSYCSKVIFSYWIGIIDNEPYCFIMTHEESDTSDVPDYYKPYLSKTGKTFGLDFCIGNPNYLDKGLAAPTLQAFMAFFAKAIEPKTDTFLIDPFLNNPRAIHAYQKAGFEIQCEFIQEGGYFDQSKGVIMVKKV